jgi:DNA-binding winged helix-turn-helix (wHTH) protein
MSINDQLTDACARLDRAIQNNAGNAQRIQTVARKGTTLLVHVDYALDDLRRLDNARY